MATAISSTVVCIGTHDRYTSRMHHLSWGFRYNLSCSSQAYQHLTDIRPCGPKKDAIRGATFDLLDNRPWDEFFNIPDISYSELNSNDKKNLQGALHGLQWDTACQQALEFVKQWAAFWDQFDGLWHPFCLVMALFFWGDVCLLGLLSSPNPPSLNLSQSSINWQQAAFESTWQLLFQNLS